MAWQFKSLNNKKKKKRCPKLHRLTYNDAPNNVVDDDGREVGLHEGLVAVVRAEGVKAHVSVSQEHNHVSWWATMLLVNHLFLYLFFYT